MRILSDPSRVTTPGHAGKVHLLSGVPCTECGKALRVGKSRDGYAVLRCYPSGHVQRRYDHLELFVLETVAAYLRRPDVMALLTKDQSADDRVRREAAETEAARLRLLIDEAAAEEIAKLFVEAIAAPGYSRGALERFAAKKNLRLLEVKPADPKTVLKQVSGGMLLQDADIRPLASSDLKVVTKRAPSKDEMAALLFAWKICKHVKSNAIVYARNGQTLSVGAGQMSRVDSCKLGAIKAVLPLKDSVAASDAFFPFPDGVEEIAKAGSTAVIQPGGSVRDNDVIGAADRLGLAMVFTGIRHFRH
jgi:hypothetical protein